MSINKRLDALFEEIEHDIEAAKDEAELIEVINKVSDFGQPLKYDNTWPAIIATMATITAVVMIYLPFHNYNNNPVLFMPASLIAAFVAGTAFFIWGSRASKADTYADKLFAKDVLFDNDLTPVTCNPERQHKAWASSFLEFNRGNDKKEITSLYEGHFPGRVHHFSFQCYTFHYVRRRTETYTKTDKNGNTSVHTRTVYDHHYRYGLKFDFPFADSILIASSTPRKTYDKGFDTGSELFNSSFNRSASSTQALARFLRPTTIQALLEAKADFPNLNFEVDSSGRACLSIGKGCVCSAKRTYGFDEPEKFKKEVAAVNVPVSLDLLLNLAHKLMEQHDNNFKDIK